jgi:hypothetical protein
MLIFAVLTTLIFQTSKGAIGTGRKNRFIITKTSDHVAINMLYPGLVQISKSPPIFIVENFIDNNDCQLLIGAMSTVNENELNRSESPLMQIDERKLSVLIFPLLVLSAAAQSIELNGQLDFSMQNFSIAFFKSFLFVIVIVSIARSVLNKYEESKSQRNELDSQRSSWMLQLGGECMKAHDVADHMIKNAELLLSTTSDKLERPALTRYKKGQQFQTHNDASLDIKNDGWNDLGGQRLATLIVYVNDVKTGGATYFDQIKLRIKPKKGNFDLFVIRNQ